MTEELKPEALALAIRFHETYERLAPSFGYETRADTKQFDPASKNGRLMVAVCAELSRAPADAPQAGRVVARQWRHKKRGTLYTEELELRFFTAQGRA